MHTHTQSCVYIYIYARPNLLYDQQSYTCHSYILRVKLSTMMVPPQWVKPNIECTNQICPLTKSSTSTCCGLIQVQPGFHPQHERNCVLLYLITCIYIQLRGVSFRGKPAPPTVGRPFHIYSVCDSLPMQNIEDSI